MSSEKGNPESSSLGHRAPERWTFDESVTRVFGDMLQRSIPQYEEMRRLVFETGRKFVQEGTGIIDLGCSKGDALAPFLTEFGDACRYLGLELSDPMLQASRDRFESGIREGVVRIEKHDIASGLPEFSASLVLSVLTIQFTAPPTRPGILRSVRESLVDGGALILVEKVTGASATLDDLMVALHHELKSRHGYTREEVDRKRLSLDGVLRPLTAAGNERLLRDAGFGEVDCFWRWMNFAGWVARP